MRFILILMLFLPGCDDTPTIPAYQKTTQYRLKDKLQNCEEYSVRLIDMREGGTSPYEHKYKIACGKPDKSPDQLLQFSSIPTDRIPVDVGTFRKYQNHLDRNILSRTSDGTISDTAQPPGYQYVGDERYGEWKTNDSGQREWIFIPMFMSMYPSYSSNPVYYNDYDDYRSHRQSGRSYYRPSYENRIRTRYTDRKPNFYDRLEQQKQKRQVSKVNFKKEPNFYDKMEAKKTAKARTEGINYAVGAGRENTLPKRSEGINRAVNTGIKTAPSRAPPEMGSTKPSPKPLSFKEKITRMKSDKSKNTTNISGYGVKTSKKFQKPKKVSKKTKTHNETTL